MVRWGNSWIEDEREFVRTPISEYEDEVESRKPLAKGQRILQAVARALELESRRPAVEGRRVVGRLAQQNILVMAKAGYILAVAYMLPQESCHES